MAEVIWTDKAIGDIESVIAYVRQFKPMAAQRLAARLMDAGDSLSGEPQRGRAISNRRRELTVIWPYLIRYRVDGDRVIILEVRHGARRPR